MEHPVRMLSTCRQRLGVETLLGLTATAPEGTVRDIARHLGVPEKEGGVIRGKLLPRNLVLSTSKVCMEVIV